MPPARLAIVLLLSLAACESGPETRQHTPRSAPDAPPARVIPALFQTLDADSNGLTDTLVVFAYLFPASNQSALPVWAEGQFEFILSTADSAAPPIATWIFPSDQVLRHRDTDTFGRTHSFSLDLRPAAGTDALPTQNAALSARFIRADGVAISSSGGVSVRVGPQ